MPLAVLEPRDLNQKHPTPKKKKGDKRSNTLCDTPPALLQSRGRDLHRGLCLGEGGFARCFQVKDNGGQIFAAKTIAKRALSEKSQKKLLGEIKIHRSLDHPNVCRFVDCFEDQSNVYILLEICSNGSLMNMLKARKRLTEPEARFYATQIIGAVKYMHSRGVIHRDLKLGNIFLDENMNAKVGDFGLATVSADGYRRRTICGTPNYIAPEVLDSKTNGGHSFEVDIWSIGIIVYTMLVGKPPFQSKEVETIYQRIRDNDYSFPVHHPLSAEAQRFIADTLNADPNSRPSLDELMQYDFFTSGYFPSRIERESLTKAPIYRSNGPRERCRKNFIDCKIACGLGSVNGGPNKHAGVRPVEITKADVEAGGPKVLPTSVSPASTKDKYRPISMKKVVPPSGLRVATRTTSSSSASSTSITLSPSTSPSSGSGELASHRRLTDSRRDSRQFRQLSDKLFKALADHKNGKIAFSPHQVTNGTIRNGIVYISRWVDYSNKYGLIYQFNTGVTGMRFHDNVTCLADATGEVLLLNTVGNGVAESCQTLDTKYLNATNSKRVRLLHGFQDYMEKNLASSSRHLDNKTTRGTYIVHYDHIDNVRMFELSNGSFQFNFADHVKVIVNNFGESVTVLDTNMTEHIWTIESALSYDCSHGDKHKLVDRFDMIQRLIQRRFLYLASQF